MPTYDIAVIGLGPAGCTAAYMFAASGLKVVAIEKGEAVYPLPRAVAMDGEIIRGFQRFGRGAEIFGLMQPPRQGTRLGFANADREWMFGEELADFGNNGWPPMNGLDQPEVEQHLRDLALAEDNVTAHVGHTVTSVANTASGVSITAVSGDGTEVDIDARYVLGCDGASSFVRKQLGIGWRDLGYDHDWLVVDVVIKEGHTLGEDTIQVCDPDRIVTYVCPKDPYRRWEFKLNDGETAEEMLREETIHRLIESWTPAGTYELRRAAVYQFHAATAETWRVGNIFIAGDAAHQTPPFLGQGMNAGMRDVINLAWKFPLVFSGLADDALLDTYFDEREAHAHDLVDWAVAVGQLMDHLTECERARREGREAPQEPRPLQSSAYGQGREQPPLRAGALIVEQVSDTGSTGYLFRQPVVKNTDGREFHLDELLGSGFAVVGKTADALAMSEESRAVIDILGGRLVTLEGLEAVRGDFDALFAASDAAIVRPDRIVFGHTTADVTLDQLIDTLAAKLVLNDTMAGQQRAEAR
ncbi:MAG: bifunctional 3-(3-hydroxy-phenyl)propionate/3-hydroxycinnamic acid hydroxylase [Halioglobus sp.]|nr:bifunctional 3-(3-hydroxy-phenyl)propionate/3-hydroxycinnamic acid hydroxylase [Halioglobus sp.]